MSTVSDNNPRGYGFPSLDKQGFNNNSFDFKVDKPYLPNAFGFPYDYVKFSQSQSTKCFPNEYFKIDPNDPACIVTTNGYVDGEFIPTINSLGTQSLSATPGVAIWPTLQFKKVFRKTGNQNLMFTNTFMDFDYTGTNAAAMSFGTNTSFSFLHTANSSYSWYFVYSHRQNVALTALNPNGGAIFGTVTSTNGIGQLVRIGATSTGGIFISIFIGNGTLSPTTMGSINITGLSNFVLNSPMVFSFVGTNTNVIGATIGFLCLNGVRIFEVTCQALFTATTTQQLVFSVGKLPIFTAGRTEHLQGGIGDLKIFNIRHDEETHRQIVDMLMKKYLITNGRN